MNDDPREPDGANDDHPQTIKAEPLPEVRGGAMFQQPPESANEDEPVREKASPLGPAHASLGEDAELARRHAGRTPTMGEAIGSSAGRDVESGTPGDKGDLGGGDPQKVGS